MDGARELRDRLRLARTEGVGPITFRRLMRRFASAAEAIEALPGLARAGAGGRRAAPAVPSSGEAERELEQVARLGARVLVVDGPDYPPLLGLLEDAPSVLTVLGSVDALSARAVALVGGRNASANGQRVAEVLAADLALAGLVVVSGMARGVDAAAHEGALGTGRTVACIAGGIDVAYPAENEALQRRVAGRGAVVAEAPLGTAPQSRHFPKRNRVIAGLSLGVVVVEAAPRSGSLITARMAQEAGRELFAVPGSPLDPRCRGSNDLIRQGAHLTESAADVLDNLPDHPGRVGLARSPVFARAAPAAPLRATAPETATETATAQGAPQRRFRTEASPEAPSGEVDAARARVIESLGAAPTPVDDLVRRCQFSASAVMAVLLELELAGRVEMLPGNRVALIGGTDPA